MTTAEETPTAALLDGRYQLGELIGQGGAARVYRAEDLLLGRTVAVKMIHADADTLVAPARVQNEIALLASLTHPSLVALFDAKVIPGQSSYLVMEFVDGPTLARRLHDGPLAPAEVASLARDLASALHLVHTAGIVHRDVKPANVLLAPGALPGATFQPKLADFGIALLMDGTRVTSPGTVVGTAAYLSPEQVRGEAASPAGDIYGLGLVLLEALTGERAFPKAMGVGAVMARLVGPPRIPEWIGPHWTDLLTRMTAPDPAARPSAREVAESTAGLPEPVRPASAAAVSSDGEETVAFSLERTRLLPAGGSGTEHSSPDHRAKSPRHRSAPMIVIGSAVVAALCILVGVWTGAIGAGSMTAPSRLTGSILERPAPASDPGGDAPTGHTDDDQDKQAEKAAEEAERAKEKAEREAEKDNKKDDG
ncbi:serine/threonine protein kinase [Microbacterium sp. LTA6]|uniref:serine/threonine-protein kinase n=1 Tax=Microbacterium sp. LTA6 TaxID=3129771 RepID=UPI003251284E